MLGRGTRKGAGRERARRTPKVKGQKPRWPAEDARAVFRKVPTQRHGPALQGVVH